MVYGHCLTVTYLLLTVDKIIKYPTLLSMWEIIDEFLLYLYLIVAVIKIEENKSSHGNLV